MKNCRHILKVCAATLHKEEGRDEIINDIESRIAELMNEKIRKGASAITDE